MPRLADYKDCTGCGACASACNHQAISMQEGRDSFVFPVVDSQKCVECKLCEKRCPVISTLESKNNPKPKAYAVWNNLDRRISSSGGAFSSFARKTIANGGIVFGAAFDERLYCHHIGVDTIDGLKALRGSKYVQSDIGDSYQSAKESLKEGRQVLFSGTPCQIAGLYAYLNKDYPNLLTLDLACHGVPSASVFNAYLSKLSTRFAGTVKIDGFEFRRRDGWGFSPSVSLGGKLLPIYDVDSLYMNAFDACAIFRESCYHCKYAQTQRVGDCSLADFWGIGRYGTPFKYDVLKGVSLVLVNNQKGEEALNGLQDTMIEERTLKEALIENHNLRQSSIMPKGRTDIIKAFLDQNMSLDQIDKKFHLVDHSFKAQVKKYATKWHLFDPVKRLYNYYKAH